MEPCVRVEDIVSYQDLLEEEVVALARDGDDKASEYLIKKYKNFVRAKARSYFLIGADREDIIQEGMIGYSKPFETFKLIKFLLLEPLRNYVSHARSLRPLKLRQDKSIYL